jgi:hypothetical protein
MPLKFYKDEAAVSALVRQCKPSKEDENFQDQGDAHLPEIALPEGNALQFM